MRSIPWTCAVAVGWWLCGLSAGCGPQSGSGQERYIPAAAAATATITLALEAWQRGQPAGEVTGTKPVVFVVDTYRPSRSLFDRIID